MERRPATPEEAKAVAHPLRLRLLRLCLDESLTNRQLAERVGKDPATVLHHVRTLVDTGFLVAEPVRAGNRGARERPYRATGKSWTLDVADPDGIRSLTVAMLDAFRQELLEAPDEDITSTRVVLRLTPDRRRELTARLEALVEEYRTLQDDAAEPFGALFALHRLADGPGPTPGGAAGAAGEAG